VFLSLPENIFVLALWAIKVRIREGIVQRPLRRAGISSDGAFLSLAALVDV
jgi:hypothetical protein